MVTFYVIKALIWLGLIKLSWPIVKIALREAALIAYYPETWPLLGRVLWMLFAFVFIGLVDGTICACLANGVAAGLAYYISLDF